MSPRLRPGEPRWRLTDAWIRGLFHCDNALRLDVEAVCAAIRFGMTSVELEWTDRIGREYGLQDAATRLYQTPTRTGAR